MSHVLPCNLYYAPIVHVDFSHNASGKHLLSEANVGGASHGFHAVEIHEKIEHCFIIWNPSWNK